MVSSRTLSILGIGFIAGALLWFIGWSLWLQAQWSAGKLERGAAILGMILFALTPAIPGVIAGGILLARARSRKHEERKAEIDARLMEAVRTRGVVNLKDLAGEWGVPEPELRRALERIVGLGLFDGRVDWNTGRVFAPELTPDQKCPRCGGVVKPAGRGLGRCEYCGSSYLFPVEMDEDHPG